MQNHILLALGALVTLVHTKALVTNNCQNDVYILSVPQQSALANNLLVAPGARYEEPWRSGTGAAPGIAIKISTEPNGVRTAKDEINFQYSVDASDPFIVWTNLANVRGNAFERAVLHTCRNVIEVPMGFTEQCSSVDDVELTLCGSERTVPAHDTTPAHVISDCIGLLAERRDDTPYPHACSGRVVGPRRRNPTLSLETVMRFEAAKHAAEIPAHVPTSTNNPFLENPAKRFNTAILADNQCRGLWTSDTSDSDSWYDCMGGQYELSTARKNMHTTPIPLTHESVLQGPPVHKKRFVPAPTPNVPDDTVTAHHLNDVRNVCIVAANEKLGKYFGVDVTERLATSIFTHTRWTDNLDDCSPRAMTASRDYHHKIIDNKQAKITRCLHELSYHMNSSEYPIWYPAWPCEGKVCKRLKKDLNSLSKDVGERWAWSDDKDGCLAQAYFGKDAPPACKDLFGPKTIGNLHGHWGKMYGDILQHIYPDIILGDIETACPDAELGPAKRWYQDKHSRKPRIKRCVTPYCKSFNRDCSDVEDDLEDFSKRVGHNTDWTTDDDACREDEGYIRPWLVLGRGAIKDEDACMREICEHLDPSDKDCEHEVKFFQEILGSVSGAAFNGHLCHVVGGGQLVPTSSPPRKERIEAVLCRSDFCQRSSHIKSDCKKVEHNFQTFLTLLNKTLQISAVEFTDENDLCASDITRRSGSRHFPIRLGASSRTRTNRTAELRSQDEKRDLPRMQLSLCVKGFCRGSNNPENAFECLRGMEMISFDIFGLHFEFQDDPKLCHGMKPDVKICGNVFCDLISYDCEQGKYLFQNYMNTILATEVKFSDSKEICGPVLARAAFGDPTQFRRSLPLRCSKVYCAPRIPGVDCATLERDFSRFTADISSGAHACIDDPLLYRASMYNQQGHQLLCMKDFCSSLKQGVDCEQTFPHIRRYYKDIHNVNVEPTLIESLCGDVPGDV